MLNRLYVGNLASDVSAGELQELFEPHGFVVDMKLLTVAKAVAAAQVAFVILATDESAQAAVKALNGSSLHGAPTRWKWRTNSTAMRGAQPKEWFNACAERESAAGIPAKAAGAD